MALSKKPSFFERISGSSSVENDLDAFDDEIQAPAKTHRVGGAPPVARMLPGDAPQASGSGQLPVDVYQTPSEIVIRTFVAGVRADELNISISRDMVVIEGSRAERDSVAGGDYFNRELFWGSFARTILLPQEVDVDNSSANAKDGLLTLILPKLDKARQTKLKVKVG